MGCSASTDGDPERKRELTKALKTYAKSYRSEIRLLLLGAGQSGKSTFAKQVKVKYRDGFKSTSERLAFVPVIHNNIIVGMYKLIQACEHEGVNIHKDPKKAKRLRKVIVDAAEGEENDVLTQEIVSAVKSIWANKSVRAVFDEHRWMYNINDTVHVFWGKVDECLKEGFTPTLDDILLARKKTTGVSEIKFQVNETNFILVDVGGQRSERRKWLSCFQDVTAILFCVAISEYDQFLEESQDQNRMEESLRLFNEICNSQWFGEVDMILFFNKNDLFEDKIKTIDMKCCFPEYDGGCDYKAAYTYLTEQFKSKNNTDKDVYIHPTTATDTETMAYVLNDVTSIIITNALSKAGF